LSAKTVTTRCSSILIQSLLDLVSVTIWSIFPSLETHFQKCVGWVLRLSSKYFSQSVCLDSRLKQFMIININI
jgi:hypothetical protein